jgi:hypothetical protein
MPVLDAPGGADRDLTPHGITRIMRMLISATRCSVLTE